MGRRENENSIAWRYRIQREAASILGEDEFASLFGTDGDYSAVADALAEKSRGIETLVSDLRLADEPDYSRPV